MSDFFRSVVAWQRQHGRHDLPWQGSLEPYRVWLSEVMLQQTQVATVLPYYQRFVARFPDLPTLAAAEPDDVVALWSGLGYYSRARNLHRCARWLMAQCQGQFPSTAAELQQLPGIGPSTAAAIAAFCFGQRVSIADGNVQRVLSRVWALDADLSQAAGVQQLKQLAQDALPARVQHTDMVAYTQGLMDLGALICRRTRPDCAACPVCRRCAAHQSGSTTSYPIKSKKVQRRSEAWWLLVHRRADGALWLAPRPASGIWSGLHAFPVVLTAQQAEQPLLGTAVAAPVWHPPLRHSLTHRDLVLHLVEWPVAKIKKSPACAGVWVRQPSDLTMGLPAPLRAWLQARWSQPDQ